MAGRSIATQRFMLQKETVAGTAVTSAMQEILGLSISPGQDIQGDSFKASGNKVPTAWVQNSEVGNHTIDAIQEFNAMTWVLTGAFGAPTSTAVSGAVGDATSHAFELKPKAADPLATFTAIWGDSTQAIQMRHFFFNSLGLTIQRGQLTLNTSAMSFPPTTGASIPGSGITAVPAIPVSARTWDVYADDSKANLGTTKLLACYEGGVDFGDKYNPDWVINSALASFDSVIESDDLEPSVNLTLGFDAAAVGLFGSWQAGALKYIRFKSTGQKIDATSVPADIFASLTIDMCVRITQPGEWGAAPNSSAVSLPFTGQIEADASGFAAEAVLVNLVESL